MGRTRSVRESARRSGRTLPGVSAVPAAIVVQVEALGQALADTARTHQDGTLATLEAATRDVLRAALPGLLTAVLMESTSSLRPGALGRTVACAACGTWLTRVGDGDSRSRRHARP